MENLIRKPPGGPWEEEDCAAGFPLFESPFLLREVRQIEGMKSLQILACSVALLIPAAASVKAAPFNTAPAGAPPVNKPPAELQQLLTEGQTAFMRGDLATAKTDLDWVIQMDPHNKTAIGYLRRIALQEGQQNKGAALEKQLDALMIPKLEFREANLSAALDFMKKSADRLSNGKIAVSFVVQAPPEQVNAQQVTLSLSNIPFTEALRYIGGIAGMNFSYEKYAIVVRPAFNAPAPAAPAGGLAPVPAGTVPGR